MGWHLATAGLGVFSLLTSVLGPVFAVSRPVWSKKLWNSCSISAPSPTREGTGCSARWVLSCDGANNWQSPASPPDGPFQRPSGPNQPTAALLVLSGLPSSLRSQSSSSSASRPFDVFKFLFFHPAFKLSSARGFVWVPYSDNTRS